MVSSAASWAKMPDSATPPFCSGNSSWSVASISTSSFSVSTGGPFRRSTSERSPPSALTACTCSERVSESGLYCSAITRSTAELAASISTMPPLRMRGEPGKVLMAGGRSQASGPAGPAHAESVVVALLCGLRLVAWFAQGTIGIPVRLPLGRAELARVLRLARIGLAGRLVHGGERAAGPVLLHVLFLVRGAEFDRRVAQVAEDAFPWATPPAPVLAELFDRGQQLRCRR